jgi:hypothetical protein
VYFNQASRSVSRTSSSAPDSASREKNHQADCGNNAIGLTICQPAEYKQFLQSGNRGLPTNSRIVVMETGKSAAAIFVEVAILAFLRLIADKDGSGQFALSLKVETTYFLEGARGSLSGIVGIAIVTAVSQ